MYMYMYIYTYTYIGLTRSTSAQRRACVGNRQKQIWRRSGRGPAHGCEQNRHDIYRYIFIEGLYTKGTRAHTHRELIRE